MSGTQDVTKKNRGRAKQGFVLALLLIAGVETTAVAQAPIAVSITPPNGTGYPQVFTATFTDQNGNGSNIGIAEIVWATSSSATNVCSVSLQFGNNLYLNNSTPASPAALGSNVVLSNTYCSVNALTSYVDRSVTNTLKLTVSMTFTPAFASTLQTPSANYQQSYLYVGDSSGYNSGWVDAGTWTVPLPQAPTASSITPPSGGGYSQVFTATYSDPDGNGSIGLAEIAWATSPQASNVCDVSYEFGNLYLNNPNPTPQYPGAFGPLALGSSGVLSNTWCTVNGVGSSVNLSVANTLTLTVSMTFMTAFNGTQNSYLYVGDSSTGLNSGWPTAGTWTAGNVTITIGSNPSGLPVLVDGTAYGTPYSFQWAPGSNHTLATASPQSGTAGTQYLFSSWSDGLAQQHSITVPSTATTYTASFSPQYYLTTAARAGGSISPASGWFNSGQTASVSATPATGYQFSSFTGASEISLGTATPQSFTMTSPLSVTANFKANPPPALSITTASLPSGTAHIYYSQQLEAVGGSPGYTWSVVSGALPGGVTLSSGGLITGFPVGQGAYSYPVQVTVQVTDSLNHSVQQIFNFTINYGPLLITNVYPLPSATVGQFYSFTFTSEGGGYPYVAWTVTSYSSGLPPGLTLNNSTGVLSGIPTVATINSPFLISITLSIPNHSTGQGFQLSILPNLTPSPTVTCTSSLAPVPLGQSVTLTAIPGSGGTQPFGYSWNAFNSTATGNPVTFTPSAVSSYNALVSITDATGRSSPGSCAVNVVPTASSPLTITSSATLPPGTIGIGYYTVLMAAGGTQPYSWSLVSGQLPPGLTWSSGTISGIPSGSGQYTFVIRVTDAANNAASMTFGVAIVQQTGLGVSCLASSNAVAPGYPVTFSAYVSGGTPSYSYSWSGAVSGSAQSVTLQPSANGTLQAKLAVTDSLGNSGSAQCGALVANLVPYGGDGPYYSCSVGVLIGGSVAVLADNTVYASFYVDIDPGQTDNWGDWDVQVVDAQLATPTQNFGPRSSSFENMGVGTILYSSPLTVSQLGFGQYTSSADFQTANPNCSPDPVDWGTEGASLTIQPSLTGLSPNGSVVGTIINVTATGSGLTGISDVVISPSSGVQATVTNVDDDNTVELSFDLTGASVKPGTYYVALVLAGATTPPQPFTVYDSLPVITSIVQIPSLLAPGGTGSIDIIGMSFGDSCSGSAPFALPGPPCPGASLTVTSDSTGTACSSGATCTPGDVTSQITSWSPTEILATVNAGASSSGFYDVVVNSAGALGSGFLPVPGTPLGKSNAVKISVGVQQQTNLGLQVKGPDINGTMQVMSAGNCAYIDPTPQMPTMNVQIVSTDGSPVTGNATYQIITQFSFAYTITILGVPNTTGTVKLPQPPLYTPPGQPAPVAANAMWTPQFQSLLGGNAQLIWTYNGVSQNPFSFNICGRNPAFAVLDAQNGPLLGATSPLGYNYWFLRNVAIHETNESQFWEVSRLQVGGCNYASRTYGFPVCGYPSGYGMTQLDPVDVTADLSTAVAELWNWQSNITGALKRLDQRPAYSLWKTYVANWTQVNTRRLQQGQPQIPPFADTIEGDPDTPCTTGAPGPCTFTLALDSNGNATQTTGKPYTYWFGDAIIMKETGGGAPYISFPAGGAGWALNRASTIVQNKVKVQHNFVYEFCTCTTAMTPPAQSCEHTSAGHLP